MATKRAKTTAARKKAPAKKKTTASANKSKTVKTKVAAVPAAAKAVAPDQNTSKLPRPGALIAEFVGAFVLTGAFFALFSGGVTGSIGIALVMVALVVVFAIISGAHFNPAVTIALWANRKIDGVKTLLYIVMQVVGAALAFLVFKAFYAASNGIDLFAGSEAMIIDNLINKQGVTQEMIDQAGGLMEFAKSSGFPTMQALADRIGVTLFVDNDITKSGWAEYLPVFFSELIGAIVLGLGAGFAYIKKNKPMVRGLALGFALFAGLVICGSGTVLNPAIAGALGSFSHGWGNDMTVVMWSIITYVIATVAGVVIGLTAYRFLLKDAECCCEDCKCKDCDCHKS